MTKTIVLKADERLALGVDSYISPFGTFKYISGVLLLENGVSKEHAIDTINFNKEHGFKVKVRDKFHQRLGEKFTEFNYIEWVEVNKVYVLNDSYTCVVTEINETRIVVMYFLQGIKWEEDIIMLKNNKEVSVLMGDTPNNVKTMESLENPAIISLEKPSDIIVPIEKLRKKYFYQQTCDLTKVSFMSYEEFKNILELQSQLTLIVIEYRIWEYYLNKLIDGKVDLDETMSSLKEKRCSVIITHDIDDNFVCPTFVERQYKMTDISINGDGTTLLISQKTKVNN